MQKYQMALEATGFVAGPQFLWQRLCDYLLQTQIPCSM